MKNVFFIGSFDPITNGHVDILKRAYELFGNINILILTNLKKTNHFLNLETRKVIIEEVFKNLGINGNVYVDKGLLVDNIQKYSIDVIVRGLRNETDFSYEFLQNRVNTDLMNSKNTWCEYIYLYSNTENSFVSSSLVRELISYGGDISRYVPKEVLKYIGGEYHEK